MDKTNKKWIVIFIGNAFAIWVVYNTQLDKFSMRSRDLNLLNAPQLITKPAFEQIAQQVYSQDVCNKDNMITEANEPKAFDLQEWLKHGTDGGLQNEDRIMLAKYYGTANSIFEWGLGESSYMAGFFNVSRYAGVDSEATWVSNARDKCPNHFRLSFADIGRTHNYGRPLLNLQKNQYDYVIAPLIIEQCPFDIYLVDGRFRVACAIMAFLHSSRGDHNTTILMHDFESPHPAHSSYKEILRVADKVEFSGSQLVALKRKDDVTDEMLQDMYLEFGLNSA